MALSDTAQSTKQSQDTVKQWDCSFCGKKFTTKYFLKKHIRLHTGNVLLDSWGGLIIMMTDLDKLMSQKPRAKTQMAHNWVRIGWKTCSTALLATADNINIFRRDALLL